VVIGRGEARSLAYRAVDIDDDTTRAAQQMVVVVPDTPLEPGRTAGRLDTAYEASAGERVQGLIHGLEGDVAHPITHTGGDRLDPEVITCPDGLE
jgi:hypothetical protein